MPYLENDSPHIEKLRMLKDIFALYYEYGELDEEPASKFLSEEKSYYTPEQLHQAIDLRFQIRELYFFISLLSAKKQLVLKLRYGLFGHKPHTLQEIGKYMSRSKERIRQTQLQALETLKYFYEKLAKVKKV